MVLCPAYNTLSNNIFRLLITYSYVIFQNRFATIEV